MHQRKDQGASESGDPTAVARAERGHQKAAAKQFLRASLHEKGKEQERQIQRAIGALFHAFVCAERKQKKHQDREHGDPDEKAEEKTARRFFFGKIKIFP